jgi:hypothetical protein
MVTISVDEGYAFDILSIFEVKIAQCVDPSKKQRSEHGYNVLYTELVQQIGIDRVHEILNSTEYYQLLNENEKTFQLVDIIRVSNETSIGKNIDQTNLSRFEAKCKLQSKFFNTSMVETKTQYDK